MCRCAPSHVTQDTGRFKMFSLKSSTNKKGDTYQLFLNCRKTYL